MCTMDVTNYKGEVMKILKSIRDYLISYLASKEEPIYFDSEIICTHSMFDECHYHNEIVKEECN